MSTKKQWNLPMAALHGYTALLQENSFGWNAGLMYVGPTYASLYYQTLYLIVWWNLWQL